MNYRNILISIFAVATLMSCGDSFLDLDNPGALTQEKFYKTEADFQSALDGCYFGLRSIPAYLLAFNEEATDNMFAHPANSTYDQYQFDIMQVTSGSPTIQNFWRENYRTIAYCNIVISRIGTSLVPVETQKVFVSEAKFIRALCYFNMVRIYGGVPLYENEITDIDEVYDVRRSSVEDTYAFIIRDLTDAQNIDSERSAAQTEVAGGKVNSTAVKALLGKAYLFQHDYANAINTLTSVIGERPLPGTEGLFDPDMPINDEVIFAVNYERVDGQGNMFSYNMLPKGSSDIVPNGQPANNGDGLYNLEDNLVASIDRADKRFELIDSTITAIQQDPTQYYYTKKYLDPDATPTSGGITYNNACDFIFLRYADVFLMIADALNQSDRTADAYPYINAVRTRAGLSDLPAGLTKETINDALARERQIEFLGEADRWFDLSFRGFNYLKTTLNEAYLATHTPAAVVKDHMVLFPIPGDQVLLKPGVLEQNTGY